MILRAMRRTELRGSKRIKKTHRPKVGTFSTQTWIQQALEFVSSTLTMREELASDCLLFSQECVTKKAYPFLLRFRKARLLRNLLIVNRKKCITRRVSGSRT